MNKKLKQVAKAELIIIEPIKTPYLTTTPPSEVNHEINTQLRIPCGYDGNPKPRVTWLKDTFQGEVDVEDVRLGVVQRGEGGFGGGDLLIDKLTPEHEGRYNCKATNIIGGEMGGGVVVGH